MSDIAFNKANLTEASFSECILKNLVLEDSRFIQTNFFKTSLNGIDFTSCEFVHPIISNQLTELKGIILNSIQAVELVSLIGVVIKED